jgi:hydrogenase maturation protease
VGVHAVRELRRKVPKGILAVEVGTAVLDALHLFERADKLLAIDALEAGGTPGTIYAFGLKEVADRPAQASLHEVNLLSALRLLPNHQPDVMVLGVEPEVIDYGLTLSPRVAEAVPRLVEEARRVLARWAQQDRL